jgi:hypothetical protein
VYQGAAGYIPFNFVYSGVLLQGHVEMDNLVQAAIAITAFSVAYPFLTVLRRRSIQSTDHTMPNTEYKGTFSTLRQIRREEGLKKGLYRGFLANSVANLGKIMLLQQTTTFIIGLMELREGDLYKD